MAQRIVKNTNNQVQILTDGKKSKSLQCNVSYDVIDGNRVDLIDTAGQKATLFADQVNYTQIDPAAAVAQNFANAQVMMSFLDGAGFFVG
jgi:hypothetical protein